MSLTIELTIKQTIKWTIKRTLKLINGYAIYLNIHLVIHRTI